MAVKYVVRTALVLCLLVLQCETPLVTGNTTAGDNPGAIISPAEGTKILAGDTVEITWTNPVDTAVISCNYNDTAGYYSDAEWHVFADSTIVSRTPTSARVITKLGLWDISRNYRIKIEHAQSGSVSESGQLEIDHIVLLKPSGGESYSVGQEVPVRFRRNRFMTSVVFGFQIEAFSFYLLNDLNSFYFDPSGEGKSSSTFDTSWIIGSERYMFGSAHYPSDTCYIFVYDYNLGLQNGGDPAGLLTDWNRKPFAITEAK